MPAIRPARLKIHSAELAQNAYDPDEFCRAFHEFLDVYADRVYRSGLTGTPPPLMYSYHVAPPVIRAVLLELTPFAASEMDSALALTDALWAEPCLEFRLLAAQLIGIVSPSPTELILNRLHAWVEPNTEERIIEVLIVSGLERIRGEQPEIYVQQVKAWLRSEESYEQLLGLKAIPPLIKQVEFEDIPLIFHMLDPLIRSAVTSLRPEILPVIEGLASRSPKETAYFLEHMINTGGETSDIVWYVRHSFTYFPEDLQINLKKALRTKREMD